MSTLRAPAIDMRRVLAAVNAHRRRHQAPPLVADAALQRYAQAWADRGEFKHSHGPHGENIAVGHWRDATQACLAAVEMWQAEEKNYVYSNPGFGGATGHFTQQCWAATRRIGFGVGFVRAGSWQAAWLVVASYDPPGNYAGQFPANVRPAVAPKALGAGVAEDDEDEEDEDGYEADDEDEE